MARGLIQIVAAVMAAVNAAMWILSARWERPGSTVDLRFQLRPPAVIRRGGDLAQVVPLAYPILVVVAPGLTYEGFWNWSTGVDVVLQTAGLVLWGLAVVLAVWAAWIIRGYMAVEGVTVDHRLVESGPYRYIRHPVYTALICIAIGTTLVFRSYLLMAVAAMSVVAHDWWATAEEKLLGSGEGLGVAYAEYASRTGRFFPRVRETR